MPYIDSMLTWFLRVFWWKGYDDLVFPGFYRYLRKLALSCSVLICECFWYIVFVGGECCDE